MIHLYDPKKIPDDVKKDKAKASTWYIREIDRWINLADEPLIHAEWDMEYAPEVYDRMMRYIRAQPDRIHVAPYLLNIYFEHDGNPILFWAHRTNRTELKRYSLQETFRKVWPLICPECHYRFKESVAMSIQYPAWVAGGERESEWACLGFTYIPKEFWNSIYPEIKDTDWRVVDVALSTMMIQRGVKALIHWDCIVNHNHVAVREVEKSIIRKYVGVDKQALSESEREWIKTTVGLPVDHLPAYDGELA